MVDAQSICGSEVHTWHQTVPLTVKHIVLHRFWEQVIRNNRIAASQSNRTSSCIAHQALSICNQQVMLVALNGERRHRLVSMLAEGEPDVFGWRFQSIACDERPQDQNEDVQSCDPTGDLQRVQE